MGELNSEFGDNSVALDALLCAHALVPSLTSLPACLDQLGRGLAGIKHHGEIVTEQDVSDRIEHLIRDAKELDWLAFAKVERLAASRHTPNLRAAMRSPGLVAKAQRLLTAAYVWPLVHGSAANPFAGAIDAALMERPITIEDDAIAYWQSGIMLRHAVPAGAPKLYGPDDLGDTIQHLT